MIEHLQARWYNLLATWAVDSASVDRSFQEIADNYSKPDRHYHNLEHVQSMLETCEILARHARHANAVRLAVWLHDVIYDSKASDNEERSAEFAELLCTTLSIPEGPRVGSLILKTKSHDAGDDPDAQVLLDADLAILGATDSDYRRYAEQIRREFAWVPQADYRNGRRRVLARFLNRSRIYHFLRELEEPARRNLSAEILHLGGDL